MAFKSFREFYPYYLGEHQNIQCRRLHFLGSIGVLIILGTTVLVGNPYILLWAPVLGYGSAWVGHFYFEKNQPATFRHPIYSFLGDWRMFWDILRGRVKID